MAQATVKKKVVETIEGVTLELTRQEAENLRTVLGNSVTRHTGLSDVWLALDAAGVERNETLSNWAIRNAKGSTTP